MRTLIHARISSIYCYLACNYYILNVLTRFRSGDKHGVESYVIV